MALQHVCENVRMMCKDFRMQSKYRDEMSDLIEITMCKDVCMSHKSAKMSVQYMCPNISSCRIYSAKMALRHVCEDVKIMCKDYRVQSMYRDGSTIYIYIYMCVQRCPHDMQIIKLAGKCKDGFILCLQKMTVC